MSTINGSSDEGYQWDMQAVSDEIDPEALLDEDRERSLEVLIIN